MSTVPAWLWIVFTIAGAAAQTARTAMQRELTNTLGTIGATQVRFLFGLPFSALFFAVAVLLLDEPMPDAHASALTWLNGGALAQIAATGLMLAAMRARSFVVTTALVKIEPVWVALMGVVFLGEAVALPLALAILIATAGVLIVSWPMRGMRELGEAWTPAVYGLASGALFGCASIGFRGGIRELHAASYVSGAVTGLFIALAIQTLCLTAYLYFYDRDTLRRIAVAWRPSLFAGFMGALASQLWFLAFALQSAAVVRTLALVEILFAFVVSRRLSQSVGRREIIGMLLLMLGVIVLLNWH